MLLVIDMKEIGSMIKEMDRERFIYLILINMSGNGERMKKQEWEYIISLMVMCTMVKNIF